MKGAKALLACGVALCLAPSCFEKGKGKEGAVMPEVPPSTQSKPAEKVSLTVLYDNYPGPTGLRTGWGFSCLVEVGKLTILFDTGADWPTLQHNMRQLKVDPNSVNMVVLSHIHGDHTGGLGGFLSQNPNAEVWLPKSFPSTFKKSLADAGIRYREVDKNFTKIAENVYSTGEMGTWIKEQALVVRSKRGLIVVTGCAHPGVVEMVRRAKEALNESVYLVIGGFHLGGAGTGRIQRIVSEFKELGVKHPAPCHCSGDLARSLFKQAYGDDFFDAHVGARFEVDDVGSGGS